MRNGGFEQPTSSSCIRPARASWRCRPSAADAGNDPLAELARLIGQSDPFVDFERRAGVQTRSTVLRLLRPRICRRGRRDQRRLPQTPHPEADPSAASPNPMPRWRRQLQGGVPHAYAEQYPEGTYAPYPEQAASDPSQAGYDYPPEAYHQGYDPYYADGEALDEADFQPIRSNSAAADALPRSSPSSRWRCSAARPPMVIGPLSDRACMHRRRR